MEKELSKRKQKILQAVVDEYITSAEPVSSGDIREKYLSDVSSATIRSELAALEEMGYLEQPHVSAGRVPLPLAYRLYVDKFMDGRKLTREEIGFIKSQFSERMERIEDIIKQTAKIISDVTNYTSVIVVKNFQ
jgi:Transcriptional regulator of heat shock gene